MTRIVVCGTTGSGKSTLAAQLSRRLGIPHVELDALHWGPNWTAGPTEVFRQRAAEATRGDAWVVDGNYSVTRDIVWSKATTVIWLDYSITVIMWRLLRRTLRRGVTQEELWNGNIESIRENFFSRESLFVYALKSHWRRRRSLPVEFAKPQHAHLKVVHLRSPSATRRWLSSIDAHSITD